MPGGQRHRAASFSAGRSSLLQAHLQCRELTFSSVVELQRFALSLINGIVGTVECDQHHPHGVNDDLTWFYAIRRPASIAIKSHVVTTVSNLRIVLAVNIV